MISYFDENKDFLKTHDLFLLFLPKKITILILGVTHSGINFAQIGWQKKYFLNSK